MDIKELYKLYQQHPCITTDSRDCPKDSIFLALKGESFDGNKFAASAIEKGCAYAIIDACADHGHIIASGIITHTLPLIGRFFPPIIPNDFAIRKIFFPFR